MDRQWLKHPTTGGYFHCPTEAVDGWIELGWQPAEAPDQPNPAVAENLAWRAAQAKTQQEIKPVKPRRGDNQE